MCSSPFNFRNQDFSSFSIGKHGCLHGCVLGRVTLKHQIIDSRGKHMHKHGHVMFTQVCITYSCPTQPLQLETWPCKLKIEVQRQTCLKTRLCTRPCLVHTLEHGCVVASIQSSNFKTPPFLL